MERSLNDILCLLYNVQEAKRVLCNCFIDVEKYNVKSARLSRVINFNYFHNSPVYKIIFFMINILCLALKSYNNII